jgi:transaldolase
VSAGSPLIRLAQFGQSIWLDDLRRDLLESGALARLIVEDGVTGVTTNPTIFDHAIQRSHDYDEQIELLVSDGLDAAAIYQTLTIEDVGRAADLLRGVYDMSAGRDGYVSLEVSPRLAHDTEATVAEARRLWGRVARPNLMIKVPATRAGLPAIRRLIHLGVNVNVTLLFGLVRYREATDAYLDGLEDSARGGARVEGIASVASFFLSRIDTLVDTRLDALGTDAAWALRGQAAIASARLAYQDHKALIASPRWQALAAQGARPQRLLWASTSTKDPSYGDVKYVEALIGADTVSTLPPETLAAYRDHGDPAARLEQDLDASRVLPGRLAGLGIDIEQAAQQLETDGVQKFTQAYEHLLAALARRTGH